MKIVINGCYGGFGLSREAELRYLHLKGIKHEVKPTFDHKGKPYTGILGKDHIELEPGKTFYDGNLERDDPALVQTVEELGPKANGFCAGLEVVEIPDGVDWEVEEYDGNEWVSEAHRTWR